MWGRAWASCACQPGRCFPEARRRSSGGITGLGAACSGTACIRAGSGAPGEGGGLSGAPASLLCGSPDLSQNSSLTAVPSPSLLSPADIRLRVRAEYCQHETALQGNVFSNKQDPLERQFERFNQANTILKSRDLGSIICDIKFSELTYLDAFWRDYINGSLLEALKGVFITDSLKQAVGHEAIKLLVNVDEEDYELGRQKLLRNLMLQALP